MVARLADYIKPGLIKDSPIPLYKQVLNYLETYIVSGKIQAGTRLPTEAELRKALGVSRVTIRQALNSAVEAGLVVRKAGKGTFVAQNNATPPAEGFIGYVVHHLISSFNIQLLLGVEEALKGSHYHLIFGISNSDVDKENLILQSLGSREMLGFIVQPVYSMKQDRVLARISKSMTPLVLLDRETPNIQADLVFSDHYRGGREIVSHLIQQGYTDIGFVATDVIYLSSVAGRYQGYREAMEMAHLTVRPPFVIQALREVGYNQVLHSIPHEASTAYEEIAGYLSSPERPQAIAAVNDVVALMIIQTARKLNLRIPEDLALVGYDNLDFADQWDLTTVDQCPQKIGEAAVRQLLKRIQGNREEPERIALPVKQVIRGSSMHAI
jgi:GntR family transcriptional regulator of arabinose operon